MQAVVVHPFQRERQILLLQATEQRQVGDEQHAASRVLEHFLRQRRTGGGHVEPGGLRRLQSTRTDFRDAAGGALEQ